MLARLTLAMMALMVGALAPGCATSRSSVVRTYPADPEGALEAIETVLAQPYSESLILDFDFPGTGLGRVLGDPVSTGYTWKRYVYAQPVLFCDDPEWRLACVDMDGVQDVIVAQHHRAHSRDPILPFERFAPTREGVSAAFARHDELGRNYAVYIWEPTTIIVTNGWRRQTQQTLLEVSSFEGDAICGMTRWPL